MLNAIRRSTIGVREEVGVGEEGVRKGTGGVGGAGGTGRSRRRRKSKGRSGRSGRSRRRRRRSMGRKKYETREREILEQDDS